VGKKKRKGRSRFGRDLIQAMDEVIDYLDGKLALQGYWYVRPRDVREDCGLEPADMAERLGMEVEAYLAWEDGPVCIWEGKTFYRSKPEPTPAELLAELVQVVRVGPRRGGVG